MGKAIEVYVKTKELVTQTSLEGRPLAAGSTMHHCSVKEIAKTERMISEEEKTALTLAEAFAKERRLNVHFVNVTSLRGKLKAWLNGVRLTPTIVVGNRRFVGVPKREDFEALLKQ